MNFRSLGIALVLSLGCAVIVNSESPPVDDDDFEFEGSGETPLRLETTTMAPVRKQATPSERHGGPESELLPESSGSGLHRDDEDYDDRQDPFLEDVYEDKYDYDSFYKEDEYDDPSDDDTGSETWDVKHVDSVHGQPPAAPDRTQHHDMLGVPHLPDKEDEDVADEEADLGNNDQTNDISIETELNNEIEDKTAGGRQTGIDGLGTKPVNRDTSFFAQPGILAAVVGGAVVGLLCAILLVMLIVYRMRKKDEGSYPVDEPKRSLTGNTYSKNYNKEFYA